MKTYHLFFVFFVSLSCSNHSDYNRVYEESLLDNSKPYIAEQTVSFWDKQYSRTKIFDKFIGTTSNSSLYEFGSLDGTVYLALLFESNGKRYAYQNGRKIHDFDFAKDVFDLNGFLGCYDSFENNKPLFFIVVSVKKENSFNVKTCVSPNDFGLQKYFSNQSKE